MKALICPGAHIGNAQITPLGSCPWGQISRQAQTARSACHRPPPPPLPPHLFRAPVHESHRPCGKTRRIGSQQRGLRIPWPSRTGPGERLSAQCVPRQAFQIRGGHFPVPLSEDSAAGLEARVREASRAGAGLFCAPLLRCVRAADDRYEYRSGLTHSPVSFPRETGRGGSGGVNRQSAYASIPCYLCVAVALTVSKVLT
jgi:hypothetical protein